MAINLNTPVTSTRESRLGAITGYSGDLWDLGKLGSELGKDLI